jgi:hypothetical protein
MKVIEGDIAQQSESLADAMHRSMLPDGRNMLTVMHKEGKIKKVPTNQVVITPNATSHVRLDELNKIVDGIEAGDEAAEKMKELDVNAGLVDPSAKQTVAEDVAPLDSGVANAALDDAAIAEQTLKQSQQMAAEAKALVAESKRLEKEAYGLNPALKPKRTARKKAAPKKAASKTS